MQVAANGGVLVIDDFGRQKCSPQELLNRWIGPLETRVDYLVLQSGQRIDVPFQVLVVFATNIRPAELVDEAFLRRIHFKIFAESPNVTDYLHIFERYCETCGVDFDPALVEDVLQSYYHPRQLPLRGCHPRDLIDQALSMADYLGQPRALTQGAAARRLLHLLRGRPRAADRVRLTTMRHVAARAAAVVAAVAMALVARPQAPPAADQPLTRAHHLTDGPDRQLRRRSASWRRFRRRRGSADAAAGRAVLRRRRPCSAKTPTARPYAVEWVDENPFERREISVSVTDSRDARGDRPRSCSTRSSSPKSARSRACCSRRPSRTPRAGGSPTLDAEGFALTENGEPQTLDMVRADVLPATYLLLIDSSQSMSRRIDFVKEAARRLLAVSAARRSRARRPVLAAAGRRHRADRGPPDDPRGDRRHQGDRRHRHRRQPGRRPPRCSNDMPGRHAVVLLTDGYDEHSERDGRDALDALKRSQTTAYVVGIGGVAGVSIKGERFLKDLAKQTGGRAFFPLAIPSCRSVHDHIATDVRQRYLLSYTPTNQRHDGTWRAIVVEDRQRRVEGPARPGLLRA